MTFQPVVSKVASIQCMCPYSWDQIRRSASILKLAMMGITTNVMVKVWCPIVPSGAIGFDKPWRNLLHRNKILYSKDHLSNHFGRTKRGNALNMKWSEFTPNDNLPRMKICIRAGHSGQFLLKIGYFATKIAVSEPKPKFAPNETGIRGKSFGANCYSGQIVIRGKF